MELVIGARREDVEQITGFHEGPLPDDWAGKLEHPPPLQPIAVVRDVLHAEAQIVLQQYAVLDGPVYNPAV